MPSPSVRLASDEVDHSLYGIGRRAHSENNLLNVRKEPSLFVPFEKVVLVDAYGVYTEGRYLELESRSKFVFLMLIWHIELRILATPSDNT